MLHLYAGLSTAPVEMLVDFNQMDFPKLQFPPVGVEVFPLHSRALLHEDVSVRRHHRRCAREMAARMSQSSGRDSADGTADVYTRCTVTHRTVSRTQRPRKSVRGAGSSRASDTVSLPQLEVYTVQALMDLALPRFMGLGDGSRQVHEPWAISADSPALPATSRLDTSGEEDRAGLSPNALTWMGCHHRTMTRAHRLASVMFQLPCCVARMRVSPVNSDQVLSDVDFPPEPVSRDK